MGASENLPDRILLKEGQDAQIPNLGGNRAWEIQPHTNDEGVPLSRRIGLLLQLGTVGSAIIDAMGKCRGLEAHLELCQGESF